MSTSKPKSGTVVRVKAEDIAKDWTKHPYRNPFEAKCGARVRSVKMPYEYESFRMGFEQPATLRSYTPDFLLDNGIIIESKGQLDSDDRKKMILVKACFPQVDIRFVFSNAHAKIYKGSKTTYAMWAVKYSYPWAHRIIPIEWLKEPKKAHNLPFI